MARPVKSKIRPATNAQQLRQHLPATPTRRGHALARAPSEEGAGGRAGAPGAPAPYWAPLETCIPGAPPAKHWGQGQWPRKQRQV